MSDRKADPLVRVGDVMTADVRTIGRMATVADAIAAMREAGVSSLVVERRDADDEFGLQRLWLISRGEQVALARELSPPERETFAAAFGPALMRVKRGA